jgi:small subunit ribosomal protein S4
LRNQARQVIRHGLIAVNGRKLDIPSAQMKEGDAISFTPRGVRSEYFKILQEGIKSKSTPTWLSLDVPNMSGRVMGPPMVAQGESHLFNESVIIEYYSR